MSDTETHARRIEFVCAVCLRSIHGLDTDPIPRCPSCRIRMEPDDLTIPRDRFSLKHAQQKRWTVPTDAEFRENVAQAARRKVLTKPRRQVRKWARSVG